MFACLGIHSEYITVPPIWHKTHFSTRWLYISFIFNWVFSISLTSVHHVPITKVMFSLNIKISFPAIVHHYDVFTGGENGGRDLF